MTIRMFAMLVPPVTCLKPNFTAPPNAAVTAAICCSSCVFAADGSSMSWYGAPILSPAVGSAPATADDPADSLAASLGATLGDTAALGDGATLGATLAATDAGTDAAAAL